MMKRLGEEELGGPGTGSPDDGAGVKQSAAVHLISSPQRQITSEESNLSVRRRGELEDNSGKAHRRRRSRNQPSPRPSMSCRSMGNLKASEEAEEQTNTTLPGQGVGPLQQPARNANGNGFQFLTLDGSEISSVPAGAASNQGQLNSANIVGLMNQSELYSQEFLQTPVNEESEGEIFSLASASANLNPDQLQAYVQKVRSQQVKKMNEPDAEATARNNTSALASSILPAIKGLQIVCKDLHLEQPHQYSLSPNNFDNGAEKKFKSFLRSSLLYEPQSKRGESSKGSSRHGPHHLFQLADISFAHKDHDAPFQTAPRPSGGRPSGGSQQSPYFARASGHTRKTSDEGSKSTRGAARTLTANKIQDLMRSLTGDVGFGGGNGQRQHEKRAISACQMKINRLRER